MNNNPPKKKSDAKLFCSSSRLIFLNFFSFAGCLLCDVDKYHVGDDSLGAFPMVTNTNEGWMDTHDTSVCLFVNL